MADIVIDWVPVNGGSYEIWYAKLSTVGTTSEPPSSGWIQAAGSPFDSSLGTASILGVDNNTQYRVDTRNDCTQNDSTWTDDIRYKLVCPSMSLVANPVSPSDAGASITASVVLSNRIEFETITNSITLQIRKTSDNSVVETKVISASYPTDTLSYIFNNLLTGTNYTVYLSIQDGIAGTSINCSNQALTTQTPIVVPPPVCNAPTFSVTNVTSNAATITVTSTLNSGDTYDISLNGGTSYGYTGIITQSFQLTGLTAATNYQIVVRLNCIAGGIGVSTSQTFGTNPNVIQGLISMEIQEPYTSHQLDTTIRVTFPSPTPSAVTLYIGALFEQGCNSCASRLCKVPWGYEIFTQPSDVCAGYPVGAPAKSAYVLNVPAGVTTYSARNIIQVVPPGGCGPCHALVTLEPYLGIVRGRGWTDLYVKVISPAGYNAAFTYQNSTNIQGVVVHNV